MESRALSTSRVAIVATVGALLLSMFAASTAQAGTIWVTDGGGSCSAFSFYGNTGSFMAPSSCPMSIQANAVIGLDSNAYWMTTAPSGITINSAWTANGDVTAGGWTPGVAIGDFWRDANTGVWVDRHCLRARSGSTPDSRAARTSTARSTASRSSAPRITRAWEGAGGAVRRGSRYPGSNSRAPKTRHRT